MGLISWLASVMILAALAVHAEEGPHRFSVDLPTGWQQASHVRLVLEGMTGLTYNPLTKRYRLDEADVSVNYMVRAAKPS